MVWRLSSSIYRSRLALQSPKMQLLTFTMRQKLCHTITRSVLIFMNAKSQGGNLLIEHQHMAYRFDHLVRVHYLAAICVREYWNLNKGIACAIQPNGALDTIRIFNSAFAITRLDCQAITAAILLAF